MSQGLKAGNNSNDSLSLAILPDPVNWPFPAITSCLHPRYRLHLTWGFLQQSPGPPGWQSLSPHSANLLLPIKLPHIQSSWSTLHPVFYYSRDWVLTPSVWLPVVPSHLFSCISHDRLSHRVYLSAKSSPSQSLETTLLLVPFEFFPFALFGISFLFHLLKTDPLVNAHLWKFLWKPHLLWVSSDWSCTLEMGQSFRLRTNELRFELLTPAAGLPPSVLTAFSLKLVCPEVKPPCVLPSHAAALLTTHCCPHVIILFPSF